MFTSAQKVADARVNVRIFFLLSVAGAIAGVFAWFLLLPPALASVPPARLAWALLTDAAQRAFWETNFNLVTNFFRDVAVGAFALPVFLALERRVRRNRQSTY